MLSKEAKHVINLWQKRRNAPTSDSVISIMLSPLGFKNVGDYSREIKSTLRGNPPLIIEVVFSGKLTEEEIDLSMHPDHWGTIALKDNPTTARVFPTIYKRRNELPFSIQNQIEWMVSVHNYPTD